MHSSGQCPPTLFGFFLLMLLDTTEKRKIPCPQQGSNPDSFVDQPKPTHYSELQYKQTIVEVLNQG
jgi:hypothetical protein